MVSSIFDRSSWVGLASRSATVSPRVFLAPAYASAMTARSPELENSGWQCPYLKRPHSGNPAEPHPLGLALTLRRSAHERFFLGQPSASAIGFHIARTTGERTSGSLLDER